MKGKACSPNLQKKKNALQALGKRRVYFGKEAGTRHECVVLVGSRKTDSSTTQTHPAPEGDEPKHSKEECHKSGKGQEQAPHKAATLNTKKLAPQGTVPEPA